MRKYEKTHPWINFTLDLRKADYTLWLLLGEAQSKCEHIAGVPLRPTTAKQLHNLYLAKGALATTSIEGNTLSEQEVLDRIEGKLKLPLSKEYLGKEIDNIVEACNSITCNLFKNEDCELTLDKIRNYNKVILKDLPLSDEVVPGEIRGHRVGVGRYLAAPLEDCEYLMQKLCHWLSREFEPPEGQRVAFGILKAIVAHIYLAWIHPFGDGNGRTARLVEFQILLSSGIPSAAAHLLSNHYNQTRQEYYRQLDHSSKTGGDIMLFIAYALQGFVDGLKEQLEVIRNQQWDVTWRNYVHERFKDDNSPSNIRIRRLVLDLSIKDEPVPISDLKLISPRIAEAYATKTHKTLMRDISSLIKMELVEKVENGKKIRAKKEKILAFLPACL